MSVIPPAAASTDASTAISVRNVSKKFRLYHDRNQSLKSMISRGGRRARFEDFQALDDVSFEVPAGTTFGLIGHNGSGKSTLLKCMARILTPEHGTIRVDGKVSALLELGAGFHPELSGRENIFLNAAILGLGTKNVQAKFDEIVEFSGLERFIDSPVKNYSSGQYVRLGFSVAINVDPDVLFVDEVLAVGDEEFQRKCNEKFADLRAKDKTIVVVSHGMGVMRTMCDQLAWLEHGKIRMIGEAGHVIDEYVAEVQVDRHDDEDSTGHRWGSGELTIEQVELLGPDGRATDRLRTGDAMTIRLHYKASEAIDRPVFGISIGTLDGVIVTGPNTYEGAVELGRVAGSGTIDLVVDRLLLLQGTYDVSASVYDTALAHPFDFRQNVLRFDVDPGTPHETFGGLVSLAGRWSLNGDAASGPQLRAVAP